MDFDFTSSLNAMTRTVSETERDGKPARAVTLSRTYRTSVDDLWDAATNPERLPRWFLPVTGDLEPGGRYQLEGNAGGTIEQCDPPSFLALTWEFGEAVSWVEVRLAAEGEGHSRLTLTHIAPVNEFWEQYGPGAAGVGWDLGLASLAHHTDSPGAPPMDENELAASPEGKAFIRECCKAWGRAAVAAGEDEQQATAAAERTAAFYTGEAEA